MSYNGSGVFSRLYSWITDRNNGLKIDSTRFDAEMDGMATGLSTAICRDGQSTITASIPFNSQKITGLGDATAATDGLNQQTGDGRYVSQIGGRAMTAATSATAGAINCSLGSYFYETIAGSVTFTFSNPPASGVFGFILELTNGGSTAPTWPASVQWPGTGSTPPSFTVSGTDILVFITRNAGVTWRGALVQRNN